MTPPVSPYRSFWMGGYEGADHVNGLGQALDMALSSGHLDRLDEDYANAARFELRSVRESVGWRLAETAPRRYDFSRVRRLAAAGRRHGVQIVWTLMHYGTPPDVDLHDDAMIERFAGFAAAAAREIAPLSDKPPVYNPINEINFLAWAVSATEMMHPYGLATADRRGEASGYAVKRRLAQAVLAGVEAVRRVDPRARFLHIEPLLHVVAPAGQPELQLRAEEVRSYQWQAWDLIGGLAEPELGGSLAALDLVGVNYYHSGQWEAVTEERLDWSGRDPRRVRFSGLLHEAWQRYRRPLVIAETSHVGSGRAAWLNEIADETAQAQRLGAHVDGICLYPLIDRHDWSNPRHWHRSGLWDASSDADPDPPAQPQRLLQLEYAEALMNWQQWFSAPGRPAPAEPTVAALLAFTPRAGIERRPLQQWLLRLARDHGCAVTIVEEPMPCSGPAYLDRRALAPGVELLVPHTPLPACGFDAQQAEVIAPLLRAHGVGRGALPLVIWLAIPGAVPAARMLEPVAVIRDCSDATAPSTREAWRDEGSTEEADLVLDPPGLPGEWPPSRKRHAVAPAVDLAAFDPLRLAAGTEEGATAGHLQRHIVAPRFGIFGPIDTHFDLPLLTRLAERRPDWNFVVVGALHGLDPKALPLRPNLHWIGAQPYHRLGHFAAGWDALLLPLRADGAGSAHCPEQLLASLASGKPVISSSLPAAARYAEYFLAADSLQDWLHACEAAIAEPPAARDRRNRLLRPLLEAASWEASTAGIAEQLGDILRGVAGAPVEICVAAVERSRQS